MNLKIYIILCIGSLILIIMSGMMGYNNGYYDGMNDLCDKDLLKDSEGKIFCDEIKNYQGSQDEFNIDYNFNNINIGDK